MGEGGSGFEIIQLSTHWNMFTRIRRLSMLNLSSISIRYVKSDTHTHCHNHAPSAVIFKSMNSFHFCCVVGGSLRGWLMSHGAFWFPRSCASDAPSSHYADAPSAAWSPGDGSCLSPERKTKHPQIWVLRILVLSIPFNFEPAFPFAVGSSCFFVVFLS